jgi:hypothetical protein
MSDLLSRLNAVAATRQKATPVDDPQHYMAVYAQISRDDGELMAEAAATIADLVKALVPFAAIMDIFDNKTPRASGVIHEWGSFAAGSRLLTVDMLRNARAALAKAKQP